MSHFVPRALCGALLLAGASLASAQSGDSNVPPAAAVKQSTEMRSGADPARWHQGDDSRAARLATLKKEIGAAQAEAKRACAKQPAGARSSCLRDATATYQREMAGAEAQVDAAPGGSVTTTTTTTRTIAPDAPSMPAMPATPATPATPDAPPPSR